MSERSTTWPHPFSNRLGGPLRDRRSGQPRLAWPSTGGSAKGLPSEEPQSRGSRMGLSKIRVCLAFGVVTAVVNLPLILAAPPAHAADALPNISAPADVIVGEASGSA